MEINHIFNINYLNSNTSNSNVTRNTDFLKQLNSITKSSILSNLQKKFNEISFSIIDVPKEEESIKSYSLLCDGKFNVAISSNILEEMESNVQKLIEVENDIYEFLSQQYKAEATGNQRTSSGLILHNNGDKTLWVWGYQEIEMMENLDNKNMKNEKSNITYNINNANISDKKSNFNNIQYKKVEEFSISPFYYNLQSQYGQQVYEFLGLYSYLSLSNKSYTQKRKVIKNKINGVTVKYEIIGEGTPIVLLGASEIGNNEMIKYMEPIFCNDYSNYKRVYIDLPVIEETKNTDCNKDIDTMLSLVENVLDEIIPDEKFLIAGQYYGSQIAQKLANKMDDRVLGLLCIIPDMIENICQQVAKDKEDIMLSKLIKDDTRQVNKNTIIRRGKKYRRINQEINYKNNELIYIYNKDGYKYSFDMDKIHEKFNKPTLILRKQDLCMEGVSSLINEWLTNTNEFMVL